MNPSSHEAALAPGPAATDCQEHAAGPSSFLLIQTAFIGDTILATPLVEKLRKAFPHATIDLFIRKGNEGLFTGHPYIRTLHLWDKKKARYRQLIPIIRRIRKRRYDVCINLQRHFTTGLVTILSNARETVGFSMNPLSCLFTRAFVHKINPKASLTHEVDLYLQLLTGIVPDTQRCLPRLYPSRDDFDAVRIEAPYITIAPSSVWFTKQYPAKSWVKVIEALPPEVKVMLIGAASDRESCERIREEVRDRSVENLAGRLTFLQSAALMAKAEMNYVNDSSPLHIASSIDAPVTAVFCSTVPAFGYGPLGQESRVIETDDILPCRPCGPHGHRTCPQGHFRCSEISPEKIAATLNKKTKL